MMGVELHGSGCSSSSPSQSLLLPSLLVILLVFISASLGAPPVAQQPPRGSRLIQLDPGRGTLLPQAVQEALGALGMDGKAGPFQSTASDSGLDSETRDSSSEWETVLDPRLYVITEYADGRLTPGADTEFERRRRNNGGPSLSIVNPLDVLRQRLLFEIARRRMKQSHSQIIANNEILRNIGRK